MNPGRLGWLAAGYPEHVPSTTIQRMCGSSQQAVHFAAQGVMAGAYDIVIAAGVESMSRVPMGMSRVNQDPYGAGWIFAVEMSDPAEVESLMGAAAYRTLVEG
jgi:acetyl-CoA acetyltransferase